MKGKLIYIVVSVMLAVTIGHTSAISAYTYDGTIAVGYADESLKRVSGTVEISENKQTVSRDVVVAASRDAQQVLEDLQPSEWELYFAEELAALDVKKGQNVWDAFPTVEDDYSNPIAILLQIVQAEAGGEDLTGKILVTNVILNRIKAGFGDSVADVVFAQGQFEPVQTGYYNMVEPSEATREAVYKAIMGEDYSQGALYFCTRNGGVGYFSSFLTMVTDHGSHVFFK